MFYKKLPVLLIVFAVFSIFSRAQTPTPTPPLTGDEPEVFFTEEIKINVSAFNREGDFVSGVDKDDLVIMEDGRLHQADSLRRIPANVLIVLDTGGELRQVKSIDLTRKIAKALISQLMPQDSVAILQYFDKAEILLEWTEDKQTANQTLDTKLNFGRRSIFVDALKLATDFLRRSKRDNLHIVLISDGTDSVYDKSEREKALNGLLASSISVHVISYTQLEFEKVEPKANMISRKPPNNKNIGAIPPPLQKGDGNDITKVPILTINTDRGFLRTMRERRDALVESQTFLNNLSTSTGGMFILPATNNEMIEKTKIVVQTIDSNYVLTYTPNRPLSESADGEIREIVVTSKRPGLQIEARRKLVVLNNEK